MLIEFQPPGFFDTGLFWCEDCDPIFINPAFVARVRVGIMIEIKDVKDKGRMIAKTVRSVKSAEITLCSGDSEIVIDDGTVADRIAKAMAEIDGEFSNATQEVGVDPVQSA